MKQFIVAIGISLLGLPAAAEAQDRVGIALSAGVLSASDSAPLGEFQRPLFTVSIQRVFADYFAIEGELTHWSYLRHLEFGPRTITPAGGQITGTITGSEVNSSHQMWNYGVNLLAKSTGRVRVFGGAGVGLSHDSNDYWQQSYGCSPGLNVCERYDIHYARGPIFVIRALGGAEIPITSRIGITSSIRAEKTAWEDREDWLSATAGVRFSM